MFVQKKTMAFENVSADKLVVGETYRLAVKWYEHSNTSYFKVMYEEMWPPEDWNARDSRTEVVYNFSSMYGRRVEVHKRTFGSVKVAFQKRVSTKLMNWKHDVFKSVMKYLLDEHFMVPNYLGLPNFEDVFEPESAYIMIW